MRSNFEKERLRITRSNRGWKKWGPYVSERQWGTVREDYSADGNAWEYFTFEQSKSRAYRWSEDGLAGLCDNRQLLCFSPALWNGKDPFIKERLFGLSNKQGNHGEDVKELYYYLDNTPTHSYMKMLYKYPQEPFPYDDLVVENRMRGKLDPEYELLDTGIFNDNRYFDVFIEYAKADMEDICIRITVANRGPEEAPIHVIPHLWFRNTWSVEDVEKPAIRSAGDDCFQVVHEELGNFYFYFKGNPDQLFCENTTNPSVFHKQPEKGKYYKDGINEHVVSGKKTINPADTGTRSAIWFKDSIPAGESREYCMRLSNVPNDQPFEDYDYIVKSRIREADIFYEDVQDGINDDELKMIQRQAFAGMLWTKQFYHYDVTKWLEGDEKFPNPPKERLNIRNTHWKHLNNMEIISMPDKWEYPWYAAWDMAFHCIPVAIVDPDFAKRQLILLLREWYMHPNGQIPAYEWNFSDVNPPVHAWACWRIYQIDKGINGKGDLQFLERIFHKLMLNFTWWVNRKDSMGHNIFEGGFLGLDNIGVFDRSREIPEGGRLEQADATSWMAMYALNMLRISLELSKTNSAYEDTASKFLEHFLYIAGAISNAGKMNTLRDNEINLWNKQDKFFYDVLHTPDNEVIPLKVKSMVGLIPLFAVETLEPHMAENFPHFKRRLEWFLDYRPGLASLVSKRDTHDKGVRRRFSLVREDKLKAILKRMLDNEEFLSDFGIRALSKYHKHHPYEFHTEHHTYRVNYLPGESDSYMFGGNSNWRGPVWFPVNYLIIESLIKFHEYYKDEILIEHPTGSGNKMNLKEIAEELSRRLVSIFQKDKNGNRPVFGDNKKLQKDPHFQDNILFYEYFNGDSGKGLGASHQTGWTGLVADLIHSHYRTKI